MKPVKWYIWSVAFCGAVSWTLRKVDRKYLLSCYRGTDMPLARPGRKQANVCVRIA